MFSSIYNSNLAHKSGASSLLGNVLGYGTHSAPLPKNFSLASKMVEKAELYPIPQFGHVSNIMWNKVNSNIVENKGKNIRSYKKLNKKS